MSEREPEMISGLTAGDKSIAAWEIVSVVSSLLIAEWLALALFGTSRMILAVPVVLAFALMLCSHRLRKEKLRDLGIRIDNFLLATGEVAIPTLAGAVLILSVGWMAGGLRLATVGSRPRYLLLPAWAFLQQYVLQGFLNRRAQIICGPGWLSIVIIATLFALLHLPNVTLAALTFVVGLVWAAVYQRRPNLFALALSHSFLAALMAHSLPRDWLESLRVGFKYFG